MREFPEYFKVENKDKFFEYRYRRNLGYMRKEIYELVLLGDENNYYDLEKFSKTYYVDEESMNSMKEIIYKELQKLGWKVKFSFAETGLFIYSTENPPPSCYDDKF